MALGGVCEGVAECVCLSCVCAHRANLVIDSALNRSLCNQIAAREKDSRPSSVSISNCF